MNLNRNNMKKICFVITFAAGLFWLVNHPETAFSVINGVLSVVSPFLLGLCLAFLLNVLLRPLEQLWERLLPASRHSRLLKLRRPVCILLDILLIVGAMFIILFIVVPKLRDTLISIINLVPLFLSRFNSRWEELAVILEEFAIILPELNLNFGEIGKTLTGFVAQTGQNFFNKTLGITSSIFSGLFNFVLGLVFSLYILAQKERLGSQMKKLLLAYLPEDKVNRLIEIGLLTHRIFTSFITGQLTEALILGSLCFLGMTLLSLPYAPAISVLIGFTALIPVFGAFIGIFIGAFLILMVSPVKALWFILFILILQQVEGNLIYPRVVGKSVGLPGLWVLTAVTVGSGMGGVLGMLIAVPVCSVLYAIGKQAVNERLKKKGLEALED